MKTKNKLKSRIFEGSHVKINDKSPFFRKFIFCIQIYFYFLAARSSSSSSWFWESTESTSSTDFVQKRFSYQRRNSSDASSLTRFSFKTATCSLSHSGSAAEFSAIDGRFAAAAKNHLAFWRRAPLSNLSSASLRYFQRSSSELIN